MSTDNAIAAVERVNVERTVYNWAIPEFKCKFQELDQRKHLAHSSRRKNGNVKEKLPPDSSNLELISGTFVRGQFVQRTSLWQLELRRSGVHLCVGLSCLESFHPDVTEIWTRFDIDIVNFDGEVVHTQGAGASHFSADNVTKFTVPNRSCDKPEPKTANKCSFWETDVIAMSELEKNWAKLCKIDVIMLRLRLYIYPDKPFDEASFLAEYREPVQLCYTVMSTSGPLLEAMKSIFQSKEYADVTFLVEGEQVKAHKFLLKAQSPVLKEIIESKVSPIKLTDISVKVFELVLKYLYFQDASDVKASCDIKFVEKVLNTSYRFKIESLKRICLVRLLTNMTIENFGETAFAVYKEVKDEDSFFKTEVKRYFMQNQQELRKLDTFLKLCKENKELFLQLCFEHVPILRNASISNDI